MSTPPPHFPFPLEVILFHDLRQFYSPSSIQLLPIFIRLCRLMNRLDIPGTQLNEGCVPEVVIILSIGTVQGPGGEQ